jgi:hypothetical protein
MFACCAVARDGQPTIEILKTKDKEVMSLLRLKFALLEQLFLAHITQSDYAQAVQVPLTTPHHTHSYRTRT